MPTIKHHPEQLDGELYMGNTTLRDFDKSSWTTKRMGHLALSATGQPLGKIDQEVLHPWFIRQDEVQRAIDSAEAHTRSFTIAALRQLLADGRM